MWKNLKQKKKKVENNAESRSQISWQMFLTSTTTAKKYN